MDEINPTSSTRFMSEKISFQIPKNTHLRNFLKQMKKVSSGPARTTAPAAKLIGKHKTRESDRNRNFHTVVAEASLPLSQSDAALSQIRTAVYENTVLQMYVDFGANNERKEDYCALQHKLLVWINDTIVKQKNEHLSSIYLIESHNEKDERYRTSLTSCLTSSKIFHKDPKQDDKFVEIIEEFASFARVNEENKRKIDLYVNELLALFTFMENYSYPKKNDKSIDNFFLERMCGLFKEYGDLLVTFEMQCKLVSELKKDGFDMMDSFRKPFIEAFRE